MWRESVHDEAGRFRGARLWLRDDGRLQLVVGAQYSTLDDGDARSLFAALGEALQDRGA